MYPESLCRAPKAGAWRSLLALLFVLLIFPGTGAHGAGLSFTPEEEAWLSANPVLRVSNELDWPPYNFNEGDTPKGLSVDFIRLLADMLGLELEFIGPESWASLEARLLDGSLDVLLNVVRTEQRAEQMLFTPAYATSPVGIVSRRDDRVASLDAMEGRRVAVPKGFFTETLIPQTHPGVEVVATDGTVAALMAVELGEADATLGVYATMRHQIKANLLSRLEVTGDYLLPDPELSRLRMGVSQDQPLLQALLLKAMRAVTPRESEALLARWAVDEQQAEWSDTANEGQFAGSVLLVAIAVIVALLIALMLAFLRALSPSRQLALLADDRFRVAVYFISVSFLALILFAAQLSLQRLEAGARQSQGEVLRAATRSVEAKLNLWFMSQFMAVENLVREPSLQEAVSLLVSGDAAGQAAARQDFRDLMTDFADHEEYYYALLDGSGRVLVADNADLIGMTYPQPELVSLLRSERDARRGTLLAPRPDLRQAGHHLTLLQPLSVPGQGQQLYLLVEAGDINQYEDILRSARSGSSGSSGETYLVNREAEMLNESRFGASVQALAERQPGLLSSRGKLRLRDPGVDLVEAGDAATEPDQWPHTVAVSEVLAEREGVNTVGYRDYRGVPVLGAWSWSPELGLGTISEIDVDEVLHDYRVVSHLVYAALATVALLIVSMLGAVLWLSDRGRKYLETQLRHGREELRAVGSAVEQSPVAVLITDLDGRIEYVNPAFSAITGYDSGEVIGRNPRLLQSGVTPKVYYESLWQTILRGEVWRGDIINRTRDGQLINCEQIIAPVLDSDGETTHFVGLLQDVSESRQLLAELEKVEASRSESLRAAKAAVWEWDIAAGAWRWDQAFPAMLGLPAEANSGDGSWFLQYIFPEDRELVASTLKHATKTGEAVEIDYRMRHVDGSTVYIHARGQVRRNAEGRSVFIAGLNFDVTELAQVQLREKEKQQQFESLLESAPDAMVITDPGGEIVLVNRRAEEMFGYSADEMVGQKVELLLPATLRESHVAIRDGFIHSATDGAPPVVSGRELVAAHRDGHDIPVEVSLNPMGSGDQLRVITALRDISERKAMQRALRQREQAYSSLVSTIPGTVYRCRMDADWTMLFMNDAVAELTGYPASDFIGNAVRSYASIIHPEDVDGVSSGINAAVQAGRSFALEYRIVHASGELRHVFETGRAEPGDSGTVDSLAGTLIDITDRVAAQEQQQESERRLLLIADAAELGLWEYFFKEDQFLTNVNFTSLMGYHPAQLRQTAEVWSPLREGLNTIVGLLHPDDLKTAEKASLDCLYGRSDIFRCEYRQRCADGQWRWFLDVGQVVERDDDGRMLRIAGVRINHHVEKLLAEELVAARDAAQAAAVVKANFLANMSHEIRTPMNAIMGLTQLALRTPLDDRQRNYLEKIDLSSNNLLTIINDILDFSKIEAGKLSVETLQFSLDDVFEGLAGTIGLMASEKDIELLFRLPPELPKNLRGDPLRLGQVLVNLCSNAVKFTESGGEVVAAVEVEERTDECAVLHFSVADTGIGMSNEQQENLFQAFSQADASTTRKYGGTGLGLAICKNLVQLMGGHIWSESELGQGSIFHFSLPFRISSELVAPAPVPASLPEALRVLVVDDNASARDVFAQFLTAFGYEVMEAQSGEQALALLTESLVEDRFDLVLMDWKMGAMDGLETIRSVAATTPPDALPKFIVVSAFSREDVRAAATDLEVAAFLTKPVTPSSLLDAIAVATNGNELVSRATRDSSASLEDSLRPLRGARILVVEDNAINQEVICELLSSHGIKVEVADNGRLAIDKLQLGRFDGILMDCQMPVMDGYEATRVIRAMSGYEALPIIAMTANVMAGDRDKALAAGMNDHVGKPI
ncbi:MAG: PAS domain-containing protein, partial [Haliea sp.]